MEGRTMAQGDSFVSVRLVDLAVSLFTLGVPFYDPTVPFIYQIIGGQRRIRFHFEMESSIEGVGLTTDLMKMWNGAEDEVGPLSLIAVCKRVMWERRGLLQRANSEEFKPLGLAPQGCLVFDKVKEASVAYALGFGRPKEYIFDRDGTKVFVVEDKAPEWLAHLCDSLTTLVAQLDEGIAFIEREGFEVHPVAVASAMFLNAVTWLNHLATTKPYLQFTTASGKSYWVREGSERWRELLALGYAPH